MKTTITDVAKQAGVSMKTVSRVLNGEPNVSAKTKEKVLKAAKTLKYSPNLAARGLASSKSYLIALLYDIPSPGYVTNIQKGASMACREHGYHLVVEPMDVEDGNLAGDVETLLRRLPVDGVILTPPLCDNGKIVTVLNQLKIPYVPVAPSSSHGDLHIVCMDDIKAADEIATYLIDLGHRDIAFIKGHHRHSASALRFEGFRNAMRRKDVRINPGWIVDGEFTFESGLAAAKSLLEMKSRPTAIFASNDEMAAGVVSAAAQMGLSIPRDLSVCGFDDVPLASIVSPRLTTIRQPVREMGYTAAKLLLTDDSAADEDRIHKLEHSLITRESTAPLTS